MGVHLGLHWGMMMGLARRAAGIRKPSTVRTWLMRAAAALLAAYGLYAFINNDIASYMLLRTQFVFFNMEQPLALFFLEYLGMMGLWAAVAYYAGRLLGR